MPTMDTTPRRRSSIVRARPRRPRPWQALLAVLLAFLAVQGEPATDTLAAVAHAARLEVARRAAPTAPAARLDAATHGVTAGEDAHAAESRPDFRADFPRLDEGQPGAPYSYTVQVRNEGAASGAVRVSTVLPPVFTNVRVTAPGFSCTRQFSASGAQAGTLVSCLRMDLGSGATAELTVEANAPAEVGEYSLIVTVDPRDETAEADEANNQQTATVHVRA